MIEQINSHYNELMLLMVFICLIGVVIMLIPLFTKKQKQAVEEKEVTGLTDKDIKKIDSTIDEEQLKKEAFDLYKRVEVAKSKFDYDTLKELLTTSLYQEEEPKLKQLKDNKQKLVATNIKLQEVKILSIKKKDNIENINIYLHVSQYDYIINSKKKVIRGTDQSEYQIEYKITLEKNNDKYFKIKNKTCTGKWIKNN